MTGTVYQNYPPAMKTSLTHVHAAIALFFSDKSPFRAFLGCLLTSPQPRLKSFTAGLLQVAGFGIPTKTGGFIVSL